MIWHVFWPDNSLSEYNFNFKNHFVCKVLLHLMKEFSSENGCNLAFCGAWGPLEVYKYKKYKIQIILFYIELKTIKH